MVHDEALLVLERQNGTMASMGVVVQAAGVSVVSPKEGGKHFAKLMKTLNGE